MMCTCYIEKIYIKKLLIDHLYIITEDMWMDLTAYCKDALPSI
jgi:hypothetical protein